MRLSFFEYFSSICIILIKKEERNYVTEQTYNRKSKRARGY